MLVMFDGFVCFYGKNFGIDTQSNNWQELKRPIENTKKNVSRQVQWKTLLKLVKKFKSERIHEKSQWKVTKKSYTFCLKIIKNVAFLVLKFGIFTNFCPIKSDLSGNTVWPQASGFQKLVKTDHFWWTFVHSKC